jgi:hypothetical protein
MKLKAIALVSFLVLVLALSGCTQKPSEIGLEKIKKNPEKYLKELQKKAKKIDKFNASYKMEFDLSGSALGAMLSNLEMTLDTVKFKEKNKVTMSMNLGFGSMNSVYFEQNNKAVGCVESSGFGQTQLTCKKISKEEFKASKKMAELTLEELEDYKVEFLETKEFIDRECYNFKITVGKEGAKKLMEASQQQEDSTTVNPMGSMYSELDEITMETCVDKETGFNLSMKMDMYKDSELTGKREKVLGFKLSTEKLSFDVTEEDVMPSMDLALEKTECSKDNIDLTLVGLKNQKNAVIDVFIGEKKFIKTIDSISFGEETMLSITPEEELSGSQEIRVCKNEKCTQQTCWVGFTYELPKETIPPTTEET